MAAPAAAIAARAALTAAQALRTQTRQPPPGNDEGGGALKRVLATIAAVLVLVSALTVAVVLGGAQANAACSSPETIPGTWTGPGSLGGVAGTGVTRSELLAARRIRGLGGTRITPGTYSPTAYFPHPNAPSTNCAATCMTTASGIRVDNARRRAYLIASNPRLNQYGALAYIWPNPYGWTGPFVVADTGSAFHGPGRLDFYIFLNAGERWQQALARAYQWGPAQQVRVSAQPIRPTGPAIAAAPLGPNPRDVDVADAQPAPVDAEDVIAVGCAAPVVAGELGELTGTPEQIVNRVVLYAHEHGFPAVTPDSVRAANAQHGPTITDGRSDHQGPPDFAWAADISNGPAPTREMDQLAAALAAAFGLTWPGAGLATGGDGEYRLQLIYRTCDGGNHFNHVHFGVRRGAAPRPSTLLPARPCSGRARRTASPLPPQTRVALRHTTSGRRISAISAVAL